jgi:hypothetical protein
LSKLKAIAAASLMLTAVVGWIQRELDTRRPLVANVHVVAPLTGSNTRKGNEHFRAAVVAAEGVLSGDVLDRQWTSTRVGPLRTLSPVLRKLQVNIDATDYGQNFARVLTAMRKSDPTPSVIVGFHDTDSLYAAIDGPALAPILITGATTEPPSDGRDLSRFTRYCPANDDIAKVMVAGLDAQARSESLIAYSRPNRYGESLAKLLRSAMPGARMFPVDKLLANGWPQESPPRTILFAGTYPDAEKLLNSITRLPRVSSVHFIGSDALFTREFVASDAVQEFLESGEHPRELSLVTLVPENTIGAPSWEEYRDAFEDRFGSAPDGAGYFTYVAVTEALLEFAASVDGGLLPSTRSAPEHSAAIARRYSVPRPPQLIDYGEIRSRLRIPDVER